MTYMAHLTAGLTELRAAAESRMTSRVRTRRASPRATWQVDPATGLKVPTWTTPHADLPFRLDGGSAGDGGSTGVTIGGITFEGATAVGHFPFSTRDLEDDDLIEVTLGEWVGTVWRIVKAIGADQKTARRVPIVEHRLPEEW